MTDDLRERLDEISARLHDRGAEFTGSSQPSDLSELTNAMAVMAEALRAISDDVILLRGNMQNI